MKCKPPVDVRGHCPVVQLAVSPDLERTPPAGGEPGTRFDGAKDTPVLLAQPLHNKWVRN